MTIDFKSPKRIKDPEARNRKLAADPLCRVCQLPATDGHHIIRRSDGDDVEDNILPLCHTCHMSYHNGRITRIELTPSEQLYVYAKMGRDAGAEYVKRRYECD